MFEEKGPVLSDKRFLLSTGERNAASKLRRLQSVEADLIATPGGSNAARPAAALTHGST